MPNTMSSPVTALAFDFGLKKIGVAVGETITQTARPLEIIKSVNNKPDFNLIEKLIKSWRPNVIIVGLPLTEDGNYQELTNLAENFANELEKNYSTKYNLKIYTIDERYSSLEAKRIFAELRKNKLIKQGEKLDHIAACVILERWLCQQ